MKIKDNRLWWLLIGVFVGVVLGVIAYKSGVDYACPSRICVGSSEIVPVTDRGYFDQAHKILSGAKSSIHIVAFELKYYPRNPESLENKIVRDLIYAKQRGVDVKVIVDEYSQNNNAFDILRSYGVDVRWDDNQTTTHAKLVVVDGRIVLLGSTNFSYMALEQNNEANVLITDEKTAKYFEEYFQNLWKANEKP